MIDGVEISMGGVKYTVPPITLKTFRRLRDRIAELSELAVGKLPEDHQLQLVIEVVFDALRRNYPETTKDRVEELLDAGNMAIALRAACAGMASNSGGARSP